MRKPSVLVVFLTVFIDLVGFGIVLPLLPIYSRNFGAKGWMIGAIMGSYSLMQFLFAPAWGRLSDRIGRRPVLLVSTAGAALSYALFAIGSGLAGQTALLVLLASRVFAGICGANITVAQAYIADITPPGRL
jgi:MFS family permease